jgi:hypothetical protein
MPLPRRTCSRRQSPLSCPPSPYVDDHCPHTTSIILVSIMPQVSPVSPLIAACLTVLDAPFPRFHRGLQPHWRTSKVTVKGKICPASPGTTRLTVPAAVRFRSSRRYIQRELCLPPWYRWTPCPQQLQQCSSPSGSSHYQRSHSRLDARARLQYTSGASSSQSKMDREFQSNRPRKRGNSDVRGV